MRFEGYFPIPNDMNKERIQEYVDHCIKTDPLNCKSELLFLTTTVLRLTEAQLVYCIPNFQSNWIAFYWQYPTSYDQFSLIYYKVGEDIKEGGYTGSLVLYYNTEDHLEVIESKVGPTNAILYPRLKSITFDLNSKNLSSSILGRLKDRLSNK